MTMPEQKMSYEERRFVMRDFLKKDSKGYVSVSVAKKAIAAQAEAIREFAQSHSLGCYTWLMEHGYIDPKTDAIAAEYAKQAESRCIPKNDKSTLQIIKDATERTDNLDSLV